MRSVALGKFTPLLLAALLCASLMTGCGPQGDGSKERLLVGAVYYLWYPRNFGLGYLRGRLNPPQSPLLGRYDSADPKVAEQHIAWCSRYGVDFLAVDWWPDRPGQNQALDKALLAAPNIGDIKFCIFYETWQVGWSGGLGATIFDTKATDKLLRDFDEISDKYFNHPQYLKIKNRPVVFLYLSRTFHGDFQGALARLRQRMRAKGYELYLIGDEVFWQVVDNKGSGAPSKSGGYHPVPSHKPQPQRIRLFDAITAYNMYEGGMKQHAGYAARTSHLLDIERKMVQYQAIAKKRGVGFAPSALPGYNDRGVRRNSRHYIVPRQWYQGAKEGSFFAKYLDMALRRLDPKLKMLLITSWNEWNEDTQIEPTITTPPYQGPKNDIWTDGFAYKGYGKRYLEVLQRKVSPLHGRVFGKDGKPAAGVGIYAWKNNKLVSSARSNAQGWYYFSRGNTPPGSYHVGATKERSRPVDVLRNHSRSVPDLKIETR